MSLSVSLTKTIIDYSVLTLIDNTGVYNVTTNPLGWGAPNTNLVDVDYAHLIITSPSLTVYDIDIINQLGIDYSTTAADELIFNITGDLIGGTLGNTIPDGIWTVKYDVSTDSGVTIDSTITVQFGTYYIVQALVFKHVATVPSMYSYRIGYPLPIKDVVMQFMLLQALVYASDYSYLTEFSNILTTLQQVTAYDADLINYT